MAPNSQNDNIPLGVMVIIGTVLMMALADAIIKFVSTNLPLWQVFVIRSALALPVLLLLLRGSRLAEFDTGLAGWVALRSLMLTLMYVAIYAAAPVVELSVIAAVLYTGPLFTTLFSSWINRERVPATSWLGIIGGFVGVLLIILIGIGLAKAYQSAPSAIIAAFDYSYLLFAAFWGFVFFHEVPDALSVVGMILIAVAGLLVISPRSFGNPRKLPQ